MTDNYDRSLLAELLVEIERSWLDKRDRTLVDRLSREHPELKNDLYEFFEDLVLGPEDATDSAIDEAEERVHSWLQSSGFEIAMKSAAMARQTPAIDGESQSNQTASELQLGSAEDTTESKPKARGETWIAFLRRRVGKTLPEIAESVLDVTPEYLVLIGRYPQVVPSGVKGEVAKRIESAWGVSQHETMSQLEEPAAFALAASRSAPFEKEPSTFQDLLGRSALSTEQRKVWLRHANKSN